MQTTAVTCKDIELDTGHPTRVECVAVCCSVLQCLAVSCSVLQCVVVCYNVVQCVAVCCVWGSEHFPIMCCSVLQCVAVWHSVLQCVAVCGSALQCVAVCCSALHNALLLKHEMPSRCSSEFVVGSIKIQFLFAQKQCPAF